MKRKVQAQRKFAQGAHIPQSNVNRPRRGAHAVTRTKAMKKEDRSIVHHNVAAKTLLDTVSFQSIHPHAAPRVLLKRLTQKEIKSVTTNQSKKRVLKRQNSSESEDEPPLTHFKSPTKPKGAKETCTNKGIHPHAEPRVLLKRLSEKEIKNTPSYVTIKTTIASQDKPVEIHNNKKRKIRKLSPSFTPQPRRYETRSAGNAKYLTTLRSATTNQSRKRGLNRKSSAHFEDETLVKHFKSPTKLIDAKETCTNKPVEIHNNNERKIRKRSPSFTPQPRRYETRSAGNAKFLTTLRSATTNQSRKRGLKRQNSSESEDEPPLTHFKSPTKLKDAKETCTNKEGSPETEKPTISKVKTRRQSVYPSMWQGKILEQGVKKQAPADTIETNRRPFTEKPSMDYVYLDMLPRDGPHVILLTSEEAKDENKQMVKAHEANSTQDYTVVKNAPILSLLPTLNVDVESDKNEFSSDEWTEPLRYSDSSSDAGDTSVVHVGGISVANAGETSVANAGETSVANAGETSVANAEEASVTNVARAKTPIESSSLLQGLDEVKPLEVPTIYLTEKELDDPIAFFEKIAPTAAKYGVCKIVAPQSYKPNCVLDDDISFHGTNQ